MNHTQTKPSKKKRTLWLISCTIALAVMTGCGSGAGNDKPVNGGSPTPPASTDTNNNGSVTDPDTAQPDPEPSEPSTNNGTDGNAGTDGSTNTDPVQDKVLKAEGEYVGEVDTHSVEINIKGTATVFQVDEEVSKQLADISDNTNVTVEYVEKETDAGGEKIKQLWLKSINQK